MTRKLYELKQEEEWDRNEEQAKGEGRNEERRMLYKLRGAGERREGEKNGLIIMNWHKGMTGEKKSNVKMKNMQGRGVTGRE